MNRKLIRTFDIFCGGGGSSRGAAMAGTTPVAGLDMWKLAADTYKLNFPDATVYQMSASSLSPHRVLEEVGEIDLLLASPECTSHSVAKKGTSHDAKKAERPRWVVVKNVLQMRRWHRFNDWYKKLKSIGYKTLIGNRFLSDSESQPTSTVFWGKINL